MDENFNSEHGFNCKYAEHKEGTNRYIFKYPETFYSSMNDRRLYFGLRSIIVKPDPLFIDLSGLTFMNAVDGFHNTMNSQVVLIDKVNCVVKKPDMGGKILYQERMPLDISFTVNEGDKISDICYLINNRYNEALEKYEKIYQRQIKTREKTLLPKYQGKFTYDNIIINPDTLKATYDSDRTFTLQAADYYCFLIPYQYDELGTADTEEQLIQLLTKYKVNEFQDIDPEMQDITFSHGLPEVFSKDFEALLGLKFPPHWSLNRLLQSIAGLNHRYPMEFGQEMARQMGIEFIDLKRVVDNIAPKFKEISQNIYDASTLSLQYQYVHCLAFSGLRVKNVWSRKDILIRSSIAEMDEQNYLGYSTMNDSSGVCIYSTPKMYPIESHDHKFWVDLYDSLKESPIELPDKVVLIIEGILHQNAKPDFINYQKYE